MHYQTCGFVYYQYIIIFIYNIQGYIFGINFRIPRRVRQHYRYNIQWFNLIAGFNYFFINQHVACIDSILYTVARRVFNAIPTLIVDRILPRWWSSAMARCWSFDSMS